MVAAQWVVEWAAAFVVAEWVVALAAVSEAPVGAVAGDQEDLGWVAMDIGGPSGVAFVAGSPGYLSWGTAVVMVMVAVGAVARQVALCCWSLPVSSSAWDQHLAAAIELMATATTATTLIPAPTTITTTMVRRTLLTSRVQCRHRQRKT